MAYQITEKYFSKEDNLFHVIGYKDFPFETEEKTFDTFEKFYIGVKRNLDGANLLDYDFKDINLKKYDFTNAKISSQTMSKLGIYNNRFFNMITKDGYLSNIVPSMSLDLVPNRVVNNEDIENDDAAICYISDLHLNHKLIKKFQNQVNKFELEVYLEGIVQQLKNSIPEFGHSRIVFVGDISYNFEIFKMFFKAYRKIIPHKSTFVILGNHELWDTKLNRNCKSIEEIVEKYRDFLSSFECESEIHLLENQLYLPRDYEKHIYSEQEILALDNKTLREKFLRNGYAIFGGMGYAGLNEEFNCNQEIYKTSYIDREQEKARSKKIDSLHQKLTEVASDKKMFFVTHMPKDDWSTSNYNKNWIYISGHTHKNYYLESENKKVYADNQIGYAKETFGLKYITASRNYDIFQDYVDGIYEITRNQYKLFYYGTGNRIDFNRDFEKLYMLKKSGTYMFFLKPFNRNELKILNGGNISNAGNHDLNYFYENLESYSTSIKLFFESYDSFQKKVSKEIKRIGGRGTIHGCIIDIDFFNHLYINPFDGTVTPYFAYSMDDKYVYKNLISLLKARNKELYLNYTNLLNLGKESNALTVLNNDLTESNVKTHVSETDIYRVSNIIKKFQYATKYNIVRVWNDTIAGKGSAENGKLIVSGIVNPDEMKAIKREQKKIERENQLKLKPPKIKIRKPQISKEEKQKILFDKYCEKVSKINPRVKVLNYIGAKEKASYECLDCGHQWQSRPDHFLMPNRCRCPQCRKNKPYVIWNSGIRLT